MNIYYEDIVTFGEDSSITARSSSNGPLHAIAVYPIPKIFYYGSTVYSHAPVTYKATSIPYYDVANDIFYNRIWVTDSIDFGIIVEILEAEIEIWNADFYNETSLTAFDDPGDAGISIDTVTTPLNLTYNESVSYTVTISPVGPSSQYTIYTWTVGGIEFTTLVEGTRTVPFPFAANWENGVDIKYSWDTIIFRSKNDYEQRRDLRQGIEREERASLLLVDNEVFQYKHLLRNNLHRFFVVPIYPEVFFTNSTLIGETTIVATEDLSDKWNLNNYCENILIVDHNTGVAEVKELSSISGTDVVVSQSIVKNFTPVNVHIYPAFIGMIADFNYNNVTDWVVKANMYFKEVISGG